jgi:glycosyltransferase involved in cell wall biosynthesis
MERPLRVAQIIDMLNIGGAQKQLVVLASHANINNVILTVVSLGSGDDRIICDKLSALGIRIVRFPAPKLLNIQRILLLIKYLYKEKFDIIHTHLSYANILGLICGYFVGIPVISTLHSTGHRLEQGNYIRDHLENILLRLFAKRIIAVGYKVEETYRSRIKNRVIDIIPNGVDVPLPLSPAQRLRVRKSITDNHTDLILISVGRLDYPKAYDDLILAFADYHALHSDTILVIVGDGPLFPVIKKQVSDLQLNSCVQLVGARDDVPQLLAASDIYVSSSIWEGLPMAILEAMMAGLPIIATNVGDIPRMVTPDIGILVPPRQPNKIVEGLDRLTQAPKLRHKMGMAAQEHAIKNFSADKWIDRIVNVYCEEFRNNILKKKNGINPQ